MFRYKFGILTRTADERWFWNLKPHFLRRTTGLIDVDHPLRIKMLTNVRRHRRKIVGFEATPKQAATKSNDIAKATNHRVQGSFQPAMFRYYCLIIPDNHAVIVHNFEQQRVLGIGRPVSCGGRTWGYIYPFTLLTSQSQSRASYIGSGPLGLSLCAGGVHPICSLKVCGIPNGFVKYRRNQILWNTTGNRWPS